MEEETNFENQSCVLAKNDGGQKEGLRQKGGAYCPLTHEEGVNRKKEGLQMRENKNKLQFGSARGGGGQERKGYQLPLCCKQNKPRVRAGRIDRKGKEIGTEQVS